ncbi:MAG: MaoC/PaaZ C-terminal domain-containing protein [Burkholderiaceae bacterium]|nr:MaoC/PaaZ C-terminal domain-containing protein [Burkholderiaceae bacterium]
MIDYHALKALRFPVVETQYTARDTLLYALGLGMGQDPTDARHLNFVYEKSLRALPTMAVVLGYPGFWARDLDTGFDWRMVLAGEQRVTLHKPLPAQGAVVGRTRITRVTDKGAGRGALVLTERTIADRDSGDLYATIDHVSFCRADGGYAAAKGQPSDPAPVFAGPVPAGPADQFIDIPTRPEMALLYRLCADMNPLHADPEVARAAGFDRPIQHGLGTFGVAARGLLEACCELDPRGMGSVYARYAKPCYPGETIRVEMWRRDAGVHFRAIALERGVEVLSNGLFVPALR